MKQTHKTHKFIVTVKSSGSERSAKMAVLSAFARRQPDGCEFTLKRFTRPQIQYGFYMKNP